MDEHLHHVWSYNDVDRRFWQEHLEDFVPHDIYDAHTHVNSPELRLEQMTDEKRRQYWVNEVLEPISADDADRCHRIVYPGRKFSCLAMGMPDLAYDIKGGNEDLRLGCERYGWDALAVISPHWSRQEVLAAIDHPRVIGVKPYYAMIGQDPTSRDKYLEADIFDFLPHHQLEVLNARGSWVTLHVPKSARLGHASNISQIRRIREQYPDITLVIAHLGRSYTLPHAQESLPLLAEDEGLYFDNSAVLNPQVHRYALELLGPRRICWGTDNPIFYMRGRRTWSGRTYINLTSHPFHFNTNRQSPGIEATYTLYVYEAIRAIRQACEELGLSRDDVKNIFGGNARRWIAAIRARHIA